MGQNWSYLDLECSRGWVQFISWRFSGSHQEDPPEVSSEAFGLGGSEIFGLELMLSGGGCCSFYVSLFSVTLLPKELFVFGRQPEKEIEQSLSQPQDESLEEIVKEVETELEQEEIHLFQAKEEKIQQFQEEMRQKEEEEAEKLHQHKEKPLRYFPFLLYLLPGGISLLLAKLVLLWPPRGKWCCCAELGEGAAPGLSGRRRRRRKDRLWHRRFCVCGSASPVPQRSSGKGCAPWQEWQESVLQGEL